MPLEFTLRLVRSTDGVEEVCAGIINDTDWKQFATFREYAKELEAAEWVRAGLDAHYSVHRDTSGVITVDVPNRPSDAAFHQMLHLMRPFVLEEHDTAYVKINNKLRRYLDHA